MFERYDERARRVLFFARFETMQLGGRAIEPEHLLLGALRENPGLVKFAAAGETVDSIRARIEPARLPLERVATSVEIPFSAESKLSLSRAAAEADDLGNSTIRSEHLVLGVMGQNDSAAARALRHAGIDPNAIREHLRGAPDDPPGRVLTGHAVAGVARQWSGVVKPGLADEYLRHLRRETLPALARLKGFVNATILRREVEDGTEFQVTTLWRSLDAIEAFAGEDVTRAVVPPAAQALMVRYDHRAIHYELML